MPRRCDAAERRPPVGEPTAATTVGFVSGTSFSSPEVAGIAATLRSAVPTATARQVRNAIILTANPALTPSAKPVDQGRGYVDAAAALYLPGSLVPLAEFISFNQHFQNIARGVIDLRDVVFYLSVIAICLFTAVHALRVRRLS